MNKKCTTETKAKVLLIIIIQTARAFLKFCKKIYDTYGSVDFLKKLSICAARMNERTNE